MKSALRLSFVLALSIAAAPRPGKAAMPPAPVQMAPACYSVTSLPCNDCPGQRSKFCHGDPTGLFQSCTESTSNCDGNHHCTQVDTTAGPACGN